MDNKHPKVKEILEKELAAMVAKGIIQRKVLAIYKLGVDVNPQIQKTIDSIQAELDFSDKLYPMLVSEVEG